MIYYSPELDMIILIHEGKLEDGTNESEHLYYKEFYFIGEL